MVTGVARGFVTAVRRACPFGAASRWVRPFSTSTTATAGPKSRASPAPPSLPARFGAWYEACLEARPIQTKMATSGVLFAGGDVLGQSIGMMTARRSADAQAGAAGDAGDAGAGALLSGGSAAEGSKAALDWGRLLRATLFGGLFYPPVAHLHYNFLEWLVVARWQVSAVAMPWAKMFLEQFVYWGWFSNTYYHAVLGSLQGMGPTQVYDRVASTLWDTMKAQWAFWIPVQLVNFKFVPVRHQLNVVLVVSLFWTTFLSLAFPPAAVEKEA